jgi:16S rRNA G527 N7-methylase RsmG
MSSPTDPDRLRVALAAGARGSGVTLEQRVIDACAIHYELLVRWNRTHNLTRITDPEDAARKHYLDCLVPLLAWPAPAAFVDVGSGAGFPGLMAALAWPSAHALLVEPAQKRVSFLQLAAGAMKVKVEVHAPGASVRAPVVVSRATFSPGGRGELSRYAAEAAAIAVWGHRHDLPTWESEVSTWGGWRATAVDYRVEGLEERSLLVAEHP